MCALKIDLFTTYDDRVLGRVDHARRLVERLGLWRKHHARFVGGDFYPVRPALCNILWQHHGDWPRPSSD